MKTKILLILMIITSLLVPTNDSELIWWAEAATPGFQDFVNNLHALGKDAAGNTTWLKCPSNWDIPAIEAQCKIDNPGFVELNEYMVSANCVPKCGKYAGDKPDIGAFEYIEGATSEQPWGLWNGSPLLSTTKPNDKNIDPPMGFKTK